MTNESIPACIEAIKTLGQVRMQKGDFDTLQITYQVESKTFVVEHNYWSADKGEVVYDHKEYSETNLQEFIGRSFENELDFRNAFNV